ILWHIRQRFIMGVEPAKETGREWAKDLLQPIPFIGSLASIGAAITAVGTKLSPRLSGRFGHIGGWLQSRLGKNHIEKLLEILWKDPHHAEFLYLDALLEDLNSRKNASDPIIFMFDHFDDIDSIHAHWRYRGNNITEAELWYIFLSSLSTSIGVVASRGPAPKRLYEEAAFEEQELAELDEESSRALLNGRGCTEESLQLKIANVSRGNPYVVNSICDMTQVCCATVDDAEELRADTLDGVRLKTWRKLFKEAEGLLYIIDRAGLVPYFNRKILSIIAPEMKSEQWDRVQNMSFIKQIEDGKWTLHDLARDLVLAELGERLPTLAIELADLLDNSQPSQPNLEFLSLSLSARAIASEREAISKAQEISIDLAGKWSHADALAVLAPLELSTEEGQAKLLLLKGRSLTALRRIVEAEQAIIDALAIFRKLAADKPREFLDEVAETLVTLADLYRNSSRPQDAEESYTEALEIWKKLAKSHPSAFQLNVAITLRELAWLLYMMSRPREGESAIDEALSVFQEMSEAKPDTFTAEIARSLVIREESLRLYRRLAAKEPARYENYVAAVLNNLALLFHQRGQSSEAEVAFNEAVKLRRAGVERAPQSFLRHLAVALLNFGWFLLDIQKMDAAESVFIEANEIFRDLAVDAPDAHLNAVAGSQSGLGVLFRKTGRAEEAKKAFNEAIRIYKEVTDKSPELYRDQLAFSLEQFGILLMKEGRMEEAEGLFRDALSIFKDCLVEKSDFVRIRECSGTMRNLSILLRETNRFSDAEEPIQDALSILRENQDDLPEVFSRYLVATLNSYAILLAQTEKSIKAETALREAIDLMGNTIPESHIVYKHYLSTLMNNLAVLLRLAGKQVEAEAALREAAKIIGSPFSTTIAEMEELEF
ncbi:MAG: tetratricopeptide repeat protein, partial [Candidatus Thorarchaeota archaeon]